MDFIRQWPLQLIREKPRLYRFIDQLASRDAPRADTLSAQLDQEVFATISCLDCANCCKTTPAILTENDIRRMAKSLKLPPRTFRRKYVIEDIGGELSFRKVPCVFLEPDNTCKLYEQRPESCRDFPHTASGAFVRRKRLHKANLDVCPASFLIIRSMEQRMG